MTGQLEQLRAAVESAPEGSAVPVPRELAMDLLERYRPVAIDPDYDARRGYDEAFLGTPLPLPSVEDDDVLKPVLDYEHFSVVMSRARRFARVAAVNIDGRKRFTLDRGWDAWAYDPRISRDAQVGGDVYADNPLDRGHLVRRLDPVWGGQAEATRANDDTFHWTNCAPQHEQFNRNDTTWQGLEDYVLNNASGHRMLVSVFNGPVLKTDDPEYRGVQLPRAFWKVVATAAEDVGLRATAYLLSQDELIAPLEEAFGYGAYRTFQVPVARIEEEARVSFGDLREADPLGGVLETTGDLEAAVELPTLESVVLG